MPAHQVISLSVSGTARRRLLASAAALPLAASLPALAQPAPVEGRDYRRVDPQQPVGTPAGKIELMDFFWYGCPHCYDFLPALDAWIAHKPADVVIKRAPVAFDPRAEIHTRLYYSLEALGEADRLHDVVFNAMHRDHVVLNSPEAIADFVAKQGIDRKKWTDTFNSFGVQAKTQNQRRVVDAWKIEGTPSVGLGGRYLTAPSMAGSREATIKVMDFLVAQLRSGR
ncbi:thiol:disulfide interchange protein DsbA/DsbL [Derxia lacustris]|uniref:thiol:disulfide interchange protein DsbA/DsbL n=1 Tax=Derxia lacustris TaxID=764842 RepID=UPI000A170DB4|nr:thiol:disulfide interchange protein DsbA/DsbL [Derxia lacustris]